MEYFVFGDIETGGLNGRLGNGNLGMESLPILELAFIVTDADLNQVGEPLRIVIHHSDDIIAKCDDWALKTHTESGLIEETKKSTVTLQQAEAKTIEYLQSLGVKAYNRETKSGAIFAGNSIMFDRSFIMCQMPKLHEYLHYRQLDITALALASRAFLPELELNITSKKKYKHEALSDIKESITELRMYREALFKNNQYDN